MSSNSEKKTALEELLERIPNESKIAVFDALVKEFQGKGRFVCYRRRTREVTAGQYNNATAFTERYPVYEFIMHVKGHDDFAAALLALLKKPQE